MSRGSRAIRLGLIVAGLAWAAIIVGAALGQGVGDSGATAQGRVAGRVAEAEGRAEGWAREVAAGAMRRWLSIIERARARLEARLGLFELAEVDPVRWNAPAPDARLPARVVLLVHGLDEPGTIWDDAAPAIRRGYHGDVELAGIEARRAPLPVWRFDYPNDQPIERSTDGLVAALRELRVRGVRRVDIVAHSMGGLLARDALTRAEHYGGRAQGHADLPDVERMILLAPPNAGSSLARLRTVMEVRDGIERFVTDPGHDPALLLTGLVDGGGEAGAELLPGSAFLTELNARPAPEGVRITVVVGDLFEGKQDHLLNSIATLEGLAGGVGGVGGAGLLERTPDQLRSILKIAGALVGDGVVPRWSGPLESVDDIVVVGADHRSMVKRQGIVESARGLMGLPERRPPAIAVILDRLAQPAVAQPAPSGS